MASQGTEVDDIASLLDQCSPEELIGILHTIENDGFDRPIDRLPTAEITPTSPTSSAVECLEGYSSTSANLSPSRPVGPPPDATNRRPVHMAVKRSTDAADGTPELSLSEAKKLLENHSATVSAEVCKIMPCADSSSNCGGDAIDLEGLHQVLAARDEEVKDLEVRLTSIQAELSTKDRRVADLGSELDVAIRQVRHRQLDLEFQHLKLEEMVRANTDMEQAQRQIVSRAEEASLNARHAAVETDTGRILQGLNRVQGSLPWTVRKGRPQATSGVA